MADVVTPEAPKLEAKHFAAGMVDRASVDREVLAMQNLKTLKDGEAVFKDDIKVPDENVKEPNFKELKDIALEVDATVNPRTRESRQSLALKKLEDLQNIITKETPLTPRQLKYVGEIAADIPAIIKSVAKDTGLTEAQVKADLRAANPSVATILAELCDSKPFIETLSAEIGSIEVTKEMIERSGQIDSLKKRTDREEHDVDDTRKIYDDPVGRRGAKQWFNDLAAPDKIAIPSSVSDYANMLQELNDPSLGRFQRSSISRGEIPGYLFGLQRELSGQFPGVNMAALIAPGGIDVEALRKIPVHAGRGGYDDNEDRRQQLINKSNKLLSTIQATEVIDSIYARRTAAGGNFDTEVSKYQLYMESDDKLRGLKERENVLDNDKSSLKALQTLQGKDVATIAGKVEKVMERSFKDYYNKSMLTRGKQIAEYDANQKTELKQKEADLKTKQTELTKVLLDKYLRTSFLRYENGKEVGYDDKGLKKLVKEDLFSHSPADMARELLRRVYDNRGDFPDSYKKEIDTLCKDMGIGAGPPRVTFNDVLKKMDTDVLGSYAAVEMPKAFGYARARGYYFDRLRLKKHQVQFIIDTPGYGEGFFTTMLTEAERSAALMESKEMKEGVLRTIDVAMKQLKDKTLGKDYQQGIANALKVATAVAAATAGTYFIGGPYTLGKVAAAIGDVGMAASAGATLGIRTAADFVDDAALQALGAMGAKFVGSNTSPGAAFAAGVASNTFP